MRWVRRQGMHLKPYKCLACGSSATPDSEGRMEDAYFREGLDVNWADSVFLCKSCVWVLGQLAGFLDPEQVEELKREKKNLEGELGELKLENKSLNTRLSRILDGSKAMKEARKAAPRKVKA